MHAAYQHFTPLNWFPIMLSYYILDLFSIAGIGGMVIFDKDDLFHKDQHRNVTVITAVDMDKVKILLEEIGKE